jgi:cytochrome c oxidase subunit 2
MSQEAAAQVERRWSLVSIGIIVLLIFLASFAGIHQAIMPQIRVETVDPRTLHISGEFIESNLGSAVEPDGSVTVRAVGQQYSFTPQCILVPTDTPITFRATSADVVHGFLIEQSNVNTNHREGRLHEARGAATESELCCTVNDSSWRISGSHSPPSAWR